jgi:general secretion pathway protein D
MQSEQPVSAIPMTIGFDPKLIQIINLVEGNFLKQDAAKTSFNSNVDLNGQVQININRFGTIGAKQKSNVVTIIFKPLSSTNSAAIQLLNINPLDPQGLPISIQNPPPYTIKIE